MTSLIICFIFGPKMIDGLRARQGKGQPIREDGPEGHIIAKAGTPTMGGLMILLAVVISTLLWGNLKSPFLWTVFFVTVGFGAIGFYDDYLKVSRQSHKGFSGKIRLVLEILIAAVAVWILTTAFPQEGDFATGLAIPLLKNFTIITWVSIHNSVNQNRPKGKQKHILKFIIMLARCHIRQQVGLKRTKILLIQLCTLS